MTNPVVTVNVSIQTAPAPSILQKTGALISQGATNTSQGTRSLLTQLADLTPILTGAKAIASMSYAGGTVTVTTVANHGFTISDVLLLTIAGVTPAGYNGVQTCTILSVNSFSFPLSVSPGVVTVQGVYTPEDVAELTEMATTFFAQGSAQSVYVLELGAGNATDGATFLTAWITANPGIFYSYIVPRYWDGNSTFLGLLATLNGTGARTYFFVTTTLQNYALYAGSKCVLTLIEAPQYGVWPANVVTSLTWVNGTVTALTTTNHGVVPGQWFQFSGNSPSGYNGYFLAQPGTTANTLVFNVAANPGMASVFGTLVQSLYSSSGIAAGTEFSHAADFQTTLNYNPSSSNRVTPLNYSFTFNTTPFPQQGNNALINTLLAAFVNLIGTGNFAGLSDTLLLGGNNQDGNPFKYWYSIDWTQINLALGLNNALVNGANNPSNPLDYDQPGINTLQQAAVSVMQQGIANGLVLNSIQATQLSASALQQALSNNAFNGYTLVNADPLASYSQENPNDYAAGRYNGITVVYTPLRGFESITVQVTVSNFV